MDDDGVELLARAIRRARMESPLRPEGGGRGFACEGRRGREHRAARLRLNPGEVLPLRPRVADQREQARRTRAEAKEQLLGLIDRASHRAGVFPQPATDVLAFFFQDMVEELQAGRCVVLPGIGAFCPRPSRPNGKRKQRLYVAFSAARNLAVTIAEHARYDPGEHQRWEAFRKNHRPSGRGWRAIALAPEQRVQRAWARIGPSLVHQRRENGGGPRYVRRHDLSAREGKQDRAAGA